MLFFRSEEHLRRWEDYDEKHKGGVIALGALMRLFSGSYFRNRRNPDYFSRMSKYLAEMISALERLEGAGPHWRMGRLEKFGFTLAMKLGMF